MNPERYLKEFSVWMANASPHTSAEFLEDKADNVILRPHLVKLVSRFVEESKEKQVARDAATTLQEVEDVPAVRSQRIRKM